MTRYLFQSSWLFASFIVLVFTLTRLISWATLGPAMAQVYWLPVFGMGLRFDLKFAAVWILCTLVLTLCWGVGLSLWVYARVCLRRHWHHYMEVLDGFSASRETLVLGVKWFWLVGLMLGLALALLLSTVHYGYIHYYHEIFSPVIFGLFDDDTLNIILSANATFPFAIALPLLLLATVWLLFAFLRALKRVYRAHPQRWSHAVLTWMLVLSVLALFARGSFAMFPLNRLDTEITPDRLLNGLMLNAAEALMGAIDDQRESLSFDDTSRQKRLVAYGFASVDAALAVLNPDQNKAWESVLARQSSATDYARQNPPHIVMGLMESWERNFLDFQSDQNDMMGAFAAFANQTAPNMYLRWFYSASPGTHPALEANLLQSPITPLTMGKLGFVPLEISALWPFKQAGYRTVFVYGGSNAWRSLSRVLPHQGFDQVAGMQDIKNFDATTQSNDWGVYDEHLFHYILHLLDEAEGKHQKLFVYFLTTTNHPPFAVPSNYKPPPIDYEHMVAMSAPNSRYSAKGRLEVFQYATDQFGKFLQDLNAKPYQNKVLMAVSGDHPTHNFFDYHSPQDEERRLATPGYFRVPMPYREGLYAPDADTFASHQSLFPTMAALALDKQYFVGFAEPLFSKHPIEARKQFALAARNNVIAKEGAYIDGRYYDWTTDANLIPATTTNQLLKDKVAYAYAQSAVQAWWVGEKVLAAQQQLQNR